MRSIRHMLIDTIILPVCYVLFKGIMALTGDFLLFAAQQSGEICFAALALDQRPQNVKRIVWRNNLSRKQGEGTKASLYVGLLA